MDNGKSMLANVCVFRMSTVTVTTNLDTLDTFRRHFNFQPLSLSWSSDLEKIDIIKQMCKWLVLSFNQQTRVTNT